MSAALNEYVDRRTVIADSAFARLDALAAQNARRHTAINIAVRIMRRSIASQDMTAGMAEILHGLINTLARANEVRDGDDMPPIVGAYITPEMVGRPITMEFVEEAV